MLTYAVGAVVALPVWLLVLSRWRWGVYLLLFYLPFAGMVTLLSEQHPASLLAKDLLFVLPTYFGLFFLRADTLREITVPAPVTWLILVLGAIVLLNAANPAVPNLLVAAVGVKVWLMYVPLLYVGAAMLGTGSDAVRLLRVLLVAAPVPCAIGLAQWFGAENFGYEETITAFYGEAARAATQEYAQFYLGGTIRRIPATFTNAASYMMFAITMMAVAYAVLRVDPSPRWRLFGCGVFALALAASLLSGQRSAFVLVPAVAAIVALLHRRVAAGLGLVAIVPALLLGVVFIAGFDPRGLYEGLTDRDLAGPGWAVGHLLEATSHSPFGAGTGTATGPARYAMLAEGAVGGPQLAPVETFLAKAAWELGWLGLTAVVVLFAVILHYLLRGRSALADPGVSAAYAALFGVIVFNILLCLRGWPFDIDPGNIYFWLFLGVLFKLPFLPAEAAARPMTAHRPAPLRSEWESALGRRLGR